MKSLEQVREFFLNDAYATGTTGIEIADARPGYAKVTLKIDERHINAVDRVMGAVYYTMADFAFAVATNYEYDGGATVTLSSQINFLGAAKGKMLIGEAEILKDGRATSFYKVRITDELGTKIAEVSTNGYKLPARS